MNRAVPLLVAVLFGCQPRTELVLGIATDLPAPMMFDGVDLRVVNTDSGEVATNLHWDITGERDQPFNLPGSIGIVSDGDATRLSIELVATAGETEVVTRQAELTLVTDQTLFYRMTLVGSCIGRRDCPATSDCVEGVCRDRVVDPTTMPTFEAELVSAVSCNSAVQYLDTGTGEALAATTDAATCPPERCIEGVCVNPPAVSDGTRTIEGSLVDAFVGAGGQVEQVPTDLSAETIEVLVPQADGTFDQIAGLGSAEGAFSIAGVPDGEVYVRVGTTFVVTTGPRIDLGRVRLGRGDAQPVDGSARLLVTAGGLEPWEDGDDLVLFASNDAYWFLDFDNPPLIGASQLVDQPLLDVAGSAPLQANDTAHLTQYSQRVTDGGLAYKTAIASALVPSFSQPPSGDTSISVALLPLPTQAMSVAVDVLAWEGVLGVSGGVATSIAPDAVVGSVSVAVFGQPFGRTYGQVSSSPDYLQLLAPAGSDLGRTNVPYGVPMSTGVDETPMVSSGVFGEVIRSVPGTTRGTRFFVGARVLALATSEVSSAPALGPVTEATVDGGPLFSDTSIGDRPELAWRAPTLGTARSYFVQVHRLLVTSSNATTRALEAIFITPRTSVRIPLGVLTPGERYVVIVTASDHNNSDAPFRQRVGEASTSIVSGVLTVAAP